MLTLEESRVLALLAQEWEFRGPPGIMDVSAVVAALPQAPSDTLESLNTLFARGLVDRNRLETAVFLTPEGYAAHEAASGGGEPPGS